MPRLSTVRSQARSEIVFDSFVPEISSFADAQNGDTASLWQQAAMFLSPRQEEVRTINHEHQPLLSFLD